MANVTSKKGYTRKTLSDHIKLEVLTRDRFKCKACGDNVTVKLNKTVYGKGDIQGEIDHITPLSEGGTDMTTNLHTLCKPCNREKGAMPWEEFKSIKDIKPKSILEVSIPDVSPIETIPGLYAPLDPQDSYKAFIRFYVAVTDTNFEDGEVIWFYMPLSLVEVFVLHYGIKRSDLIDYMSRPTFHNDVLAESIIKKQIINVAQGNTLFRQGSNLHSVSITENYVSTGQKKEDKSPVVLNISGNLIANVFQKYGIDSPKENEN